MKKTEQETLSAQALCQKILTLLDDKKAQQVVTIDLSGKSSISDYLVIASGTSARQVGALADILYRELKTIGVLSTIEGMPQCDWVLVDAGDVVVHLFRPEVRAFYNLEKMWGVEISDTLTTA